MCHATRAAKSADGVIIGGSNSSAAKIQPEHDQPSTAGRGGGIDRGARHHLVLGKHVDISNTALDPASAKEPSDQSETPSSMLTWWPGITHTTSSVNEEPNSGDQARCISEEKQNDFALVPLSSRFDIYPECREEQIAYSPLVVERAKDTPTLALSIPQIQPYIQEQPHHLDLQLQQRRFNCNWNGCTKAYFSLPHLNRHITASSHGPSRKKRGRYCEVLLFHAN